MDSGLFPVALYGSRRRFSKVTKFDKSMLLHG